MNQEERMRTQRAEFDALAGLCKSFCSLPAVVDDSYPESRHYYESALRVFLEACAANGRRLRPTSSETALWEALGRWTVDLVQGGKNANLAPPGYVLDAVTDLASGRVA